MPDPSASQPMNMPGVQPEIDETPDVSQLDSLPGFAKLPDVEREIFRKTIILQIPYYERLERWANDANTIKSGRDASTALRTYIAYQDDFAEKMQVLDKEFQGKIDPGYLESKQFGKVVDAYMSDPQLTKRIEYIMQSYVSLLQRFKNDPACKEVFEDLNRMAAEAQP